MEWTPVDKELPKKPGNYFIWHPGIAPYDMVGFFSKYLQEWNTQFFNATHPTHWMKIEPPEDK